MRHIKLYEDFGYDNYYHGTTATRAKNIRDVGFYPQHDVNITTDYSEAFEYAEELADDEDDKPEVIEVKLKPNALSRAEENDDDDGGLDSMAYDSKYVELK